jgi:hypothetical protein
MTNEPRTCLGAYLAQVERGLHSLPARRRRLFLRELEAHLLDEAEALGINEESQMQGFLDRKEAPWELARELSGGEDLDLGHRHSAATLAGGVIGVAMGAHLFFTGWNWTIALAFALGIGLAVGTGLFWARGIWQRLGSTPRLAAAVALSALLAIPLGFTSTRGFVISRLFYGAYTGYVLERHAQQRPLWQWLIEVSVFTGLVFLVESLVLHRYPLNRVTLMVVAMEWSFNATLHLAVVGALRLRRVLAERWILSPGNSL